jgi:hypothetical protein
LVGLGAVVILAIPAPAMAAQANPIVDVMVDNGEITYVGVDNIPLDQTISDWLVPFCNAQGPDYPTAKDLEKQWKKTGTASCRSSFWPGTLIIVPGA